MDSESTLRVGQVVVTVGFSPPTPEAKARYDRRIDTLAAWLLSRWEAERREEEHGCARAAG
jgi:hypothetical protein